jgi:nitrite reductase (NO-forming)
MNKPIIAGIAAGVLLAGIILGPMPGLFNVEAQDTSTGITKRVTLIADEVDVQVAPDNALHPGGVMYRAMVFNGTTPGPVISVDQGDTIEFTLINEGEVIHSIDFHAGFGPLAAVGSNASEHGSNVQSGESVTWTWSPPYAGVFYYHCGADGLNGVWEHIANGMYGGIVVHPQNEEPAKEFYVVFGEIYGNSPVFTAANDTGQFNVTKFLDRNPDIVMTNGMAHKYVPAVGSFSQIPLNPDAEVFQVKPGELTRWFIVNGGPADDVAFHFISGIISVHDGSVKNRYGTQDLNDETWNIPPGSGTVIEATFPDEGIYVGVDHAMDDVLKGAAFAVLATQNSTETDHPQGTWVPPKGSAMVSGPSAMANATAAAGNVTEGAAANVTGGNVTGANVTAANQTLPLTNVTGGNVTGGNVTGGNVTGGNVTGGNVTGGNVTGGNVTGTTGATGGGGGATTGVSIVPGASSLTDTAFQPNPVQVSVGDTVTWTNDDSQPHTVTSGQNGQPDNKFNSSPNFNPLMAPGQTFSHTFTEAGEYPYFCMLHPNQVGTVSVS